MRRKCDFDVEITRDIINKASNFQTLILFSGDGDYATLVRDMIIKGKKVIVVFAPDHKGREYNDLKIEIIENNLSGLFLCNIKKLQIVLGNKYPQRLLPGA